MGSRLPVREWEGSVVLGTLLPTGVSVLVLVELEGTELVAAAEEVPVTAGVESGAPKSVLVPAGTFVGRTLGGWDVMSSSRATGESMDCEWEGCWVVVPETPVLGVVLLPSLWGRAVLIHELPPIGPVESVLELSESTRGSTLFAASDEWGPLVVDVAEPTVVVLPSSESTRGSALFARSEE